MFATCMLALLLASQKPTDLNVVPLESLDLSAVRQSEGRPMKDLSVDGQPLKLGDTTYDHGVGVQAESYFRLKLEKRGRSFHALVGLNRGTQRSWGAVRFWIEGDGKILARSQVLTPRSAPEEIKADLNGVDVATLVCAASGFGIGGDHGDWVNAEFTMNPGAVPVPLAYPDEKPVILTPPSGPKPRFTGPRVFGVRPGHPIVFGVTATGDRPMTFLAANLPEGVQIDPKSGMLSGKLERPGKYSLRLTARNSKGYAQQSFQIVVGEKLALTPPMGWNSWNSWGGQVTGDEVQAAAKAMAAKLRDHGWLYVNIDDTWQGVRGGPYNAIIPNKKFPDMAGLVATIHSLGLKAGIYSTPWMGSYAGHIGGSADNADGTYPWLANADDTGFSRDALRAHRFGSVSFADRDVKQYVDWGFDYLKYDWNPIDIPHTQEAYGLLRNSGRDVVLSLSNDAPYANGAALGEYSQAWRTSGDMSDTWGAVKANAFSLNKWAKFQGPGHWDDEDMLVVGQVTLGDKMHASRLTPDEQYLHISQWCMLGSPLLIGCDLDNLDPFTLNLLTNDEVLDIDQDPLGVMAKPLRQTDSEQVWVKPLIDGGHAVGLYNTSEDPRTIKVSWMQLRLKGASHNVRDLWRQKDLGRKDRLEVVVPRHGVVLLKVS
jgi:alpha-galactosidase